MEKPISYFPLSQFVIPDSIKITEEIAELDKEMKQVEDNINKIFDSVRDEN